MSLIFVIIIAVGLSVDAFSLSLAYGTLNLEKRYIRLLSMMIGLYHFFMPLLGMQLGKFILNILPIAAHFIVAIVLVVIGIEMIIDSFKQERVVNIMKFSELLIFGLAVSLDSFSVGIGLTSLYPYPIVCTTLFSISAFLFTYMGLCLGKKINDKIGTISTTIGGLVLIIVGILHL